MATHSRLLVSIFFVLTIIGLSLLSSNAISEDCGLAVYWGRKGFDHSLSELCSTGNYKYVITYEVDIGEIHPTTIIDQPPHITNVSADVRYCQSQGIKVFVSLIGGIPYKDPRTPTPDKMADILWRAFIEGIGPPLPFQGSYFDGIDFAVTSGHPLYHRALAGALRQRINNNVDKKVYLSASPSCAYPSSVLQVAINNGFFDYIWPNFYDDASCDYSQNGIDGLVSSWNNWMKNTPPGIGSKFFLGLPASPEAAKTGFVPRDTLAYEILPRIRYGDRYTGVKLWDWYYDNATNYGSSIRAPVCDYTNVELVRKEELMISQVI